MVDVCLVISNFFFLFGMLIFSKLFASPPAKDENPHGFRPLPTFDDVSAKD